MENILMECKQSGMCVEKQQCIAQTGGYFGFVPDTSLKLYHGTPVYWNDIPNILQAHALVKIVAPITTLNVEYPLIHT